MPSGRTHTPAGTENRLLNGIGGVRTFSSAAGFYFNLSDRSW